MTVSNKPLGLPPEHEPVVTTQPWGSLCRLTDARIALGRAGHSLPTCAHLKFHLAHAQARDAVHVAFEREPLAADISDLGLTVLDVCSAAPNRATYLQRPDWGPSPELAVRCRAEGLARPQPRVGRTDAERNCISNVRPAGLAPEAAAYKLRRLMQAARTLQLTGVGLKDQDPTFALE